MNFKTLKAKMEEHFDTIQESASAGEMPPITEIEAFERLVKRMASFVQDDWAGELEDFHHMTRQLLHSARKGEVQEAIRIVESLNDAQTFCHQSFRY